MDMVVKSSFSPDGDGSSVNYQESNVILATQISGWDSILKCIVPNQPKSFSSDMHKVQCITDRPDIYHAYKIIVEILCAFRISCKSVNIQHFLEGRLNCFSVLWYADSAVVRFKYS